MPQSYSPVYFPSDWSAVSMGANNVVVDAPVDNATREVTLSPCLDPGSAINQGSAATYSNNNLIASGNSAHTTLKTNTLTDGSSKYVWEVTVVKHDTNIRIGAILPGDKVSGGNTLGSHATAGQGWSFVADVGSGNTSQYRGTNMVTGMSTMADGDMYHLEFNNTTGDVFVWRKAAGGSWAAENSGATVVNDDGANNGKTALAGAKVYLAGHLYQTAGTNLMRFNFAGPFEYPASATYVPFTQTVTGVGNHWTLNPLASTDTLTNGNLSFTAAANFTTYVTAPAIPMSGKWYYEVKATGGDAAIGTSASYDAYLGLVRTDVAIPTGSHTSNANLWVIANWNPTPSGQKNNNSTATYTPTSGFNDGSIIMVAVDMDNNAIWFGNDNTWAGSATASEIAAGTTTNAAFTSSNNSFGSHQMMPYHGAHSELATYNFGAKPFVYTPPTGFKALSTANLPAPTVTDPSKYFQTVAYSGSSDTTLTVNTNFQADFVWMKERSDSRSHALFDIVRGAGKIQYSDGGYAEDTNEVNGYLDQFYDATGSNSFRLTDGSTSGNNVKGNGNTYLAYCWKAGSSNTSVSESGSGSGAINACTHRANTTSGFSIIKYTGFNDTISNGEHTLVTHGLGSPPVFMMAKGLSGSLDWCVIPGENGGGSWSTDNHMHLNEVDGSSGALHVQPAFPTDTHVKVGNDDIINKDGVEFIMYAWIRVPGLVGYGTYTGGGSSFNPVIQINDGGSGFRPAWLMIKRAASGSGGNESWVIFNNQSDPYNPSNHYIMADATNGENDGTGGNDIDFLANGFTCKTTNTATNGTTLYMYLAFAEHPFGGDGVAQARAR
jgi:hypothetical protein